MHPDPTHYERNLPHWLPPGATLFVTYRLAGALPQAVLAQMRAEAQLATQHSPKRSFSEYDRWLDHDPEGPHWLAQPAVAAIVQQSLHFYHPLHYSLHAYCVMSNHVHLVISLAEQPTKPLVEVLQAQKSYSANQANKLLGRTGQFWTRESYDHLIRSGPEYDRVVAYVLNNPVKAGLVDDWRDWPYSFWAEG